MFSLFLAVCVYLRVLVEKQCQLKFLTNLYLQKFNLLPSLHYYLPCFYLQSGVGRTDMLLSGICASGTQGYSN